MFRHKENSTDNKSSSSQEEVGGVAEVAEKKVSVTDKPEPSLKELIEKNLKWSQIIYEQNRKINSKLLWTAIANWLRLLLLAASAVLTILFLWPMLKGVFSQYSYLLGKNSTGNSTSTNQNSMDDFLKLFNLDPAKQEQIKALLK